MPVDTEHPAFEQPSNINVRVWRYTSFVKYVSFLQTSSLYLSQVKILAKNDPYEGTTTKNEFTKIELGDKIAIHSQKFRKVGLSTNYVSCWHMNEHESQAMWRLYSSHLSEAVCIQTTYKKLSDALPDIPGIDSEHYFIGKVKYIDHHVDDMPPDNNFYPIMHKLNSFEHEREIRVVYWKRDPGTSNQETLDNYPAGIEVPIDIENTIEKIIISPTAPTWFSTTVEQVTRKYGITIPLHKSALANLPYA